MKKVYLLTSAALLVAAGFAIPGCSEAQKAAEAGAEQCGLTCDAEMVANGKANVSGVANIDSFFQAVVDFQSTAQLVTDGLTEPLARLKAQVGLSADASAADFQAAVVAKYGLAGNIAIAYAPPRCEVSAQATVEATAKCDVNVNPGTAKVECSGRCDAEVQVSGGELSCEGDAKLNCTAPSANVACSGNCKGTCTLDAAATCNGTCNGQCDGTCSVEDSDGNCAGTCDGTCSGKCELTGGGECQGTCDGECSVEAQGGSCDANAKVECFAEPPEGELNVQCSGKCEGEVTPPSASAECEASAKASAEVHAECTPPSIEVTYQFAASATADMQAAFEGQFMASLQANLGAVVANLKRADIVLKAGADVVAKIPAVTDSFNAAASGDVNLKIAAGLACAVTNIAAVPNIITDATSSLSGSVSTSATFVAGLKGS